MERPLTPAERLKLAFEALRRRVGPLKVVASHVRVKEAHLQRYGSDEPDNAAYHAPVDIIATLETLAGEPLVTRLLADLSGHVLVKRPDAPATRGDLLDLLAQKARESGELTAAAIACCGAVDAEPTARIAAARKAIKELDDVVAVSMAMRAELTTLLGED